MLLTITKIDPHPSNKNMEIVRLSNKAQCIVKAKEYLVNDQVEFEYEDEIVGDLLSEGKIVLVKDDE